MKAHAEKRAMTNVWVADGQHDIEKMAHAEERAMIEKMAHAEKRAVMNVSVECLVFIPLVFLGLLTSHDSFVVLDSLGSFRVTGSLTRLHGLMQGPQAGVLLNLSIDCSLLECSSRFLGLLPLFLDARLTRDHERILGAMLQVRCVTGDVNLRIAMLAQCCGCVVHDTGRGLLGGSGHRVMQCSRSVSSGAPFPCASYILRELFAVVPPSPLLLKPHPTLVSGRAPTGGRGWRGILGEMDSIRVVELCLPRLRGLAEGI